MGVDLDLASFIEEQISYTHESARVRSSSTIRKASGAQDFLEDVESASYALSICGRNWRRQNFAAARRVNQKRDF